MSRFYTAPTAKSPGQVVASNDPNSINTATDSAFTILQVELDSAYCKFAGWTTNADAGGYRLANLGPAVYPTDAVSLSTAQSLISAGGVPGNIAVTDLNYGTMTDGQYLGRVGTSLLGVTIKKAPSKIYAHRTLGAF